MIFIRSRSGQMDRTAESCLDSEAFAVPQGPGSDMSEFCMLGIYCVNIKGVNNKKKLKLINF